MGLTNLILNTNEEIIRQEQNNLLQLKSLFEEFILTKKTDLENFFNNFSYKMEKDIYPNHNNLASVLEKLINNKKIKLTFKHDASDELNKRVFIEILLINTTNNTYNSKKFIDIIFNNDIIESIKPLNKITSQEELDLLKIIINTILEK